MTEQELANVIWDIKEIIRNSYDDSEVEDVILPFTLLRRLDCVLEDKYEAILEELSKCEENLKKYKRQSLMKKNGLTFFNMSGLSLKKLLNSPDQISDSFKTYIEGFTDNVRDILANFVHEDGDSDVVDLSKIYARLDRGNKLFAVIQQFVEKADLHPSKVSNAMMGTIFEIVIRRSKESTNTKAGQYYTPREVVKLLVSLTMCGKEQELFIPGKAFTIYDPCCGTGGMLTVGREHLQEMAQNKNLKVYLYGQELSEKTYAICKADLLMKGDDQNLDQQLFQGDTLADDKLYGKKFNFMLANPPFGVDWGKDQNVKKAVLKDNCPGGRFEAGLPSTSDGSLLFLQHMIAKMDDQAGSRIGIVLNGSPLFNGDAGNGWSNIRKMLLDRNLLDAIVALPKNLFYGTDITTYLWILDNKRPAEKYHKALFIDAAHTKEFTNLLQKNLGKKRYEISDEGTKEIFDIYKEYQSYSRDIEYEKTGEMEHLEIAKLLDYDDFLYTNVAVRRPLRLWFENISVKYDALCENEDFYAEDKKNVILRDIAQLENCSEKRSDHEFFVWLKENKVKTTKAQQKLIRDAFGEINENAPIAYVDPFKNSGEWVIDTNLNDTEKIPMKRDIEEYFETEVVPFASDAWMDRSKDKVGCEFPFTRLFYKYRPMRSSQEILADLSALDSNLNNELSHLNED